MKKSSLHQFLNYTLTTDMYMADVPGHAPKEALPALAEGYSKLMEKDKSIITKLNFWAEKYPSIPQFKNYISTYYSLHNDKEKAMQVNNELSEKFPDYIFAKINKANFFLFDDEEEQVPELLGENLELTELYPQRKIFHYDEYFAFYETAGMYYCQVNELDKAEAILENLFEVAELLDIDRDFEKLQNSILLTRLQTIIPDKFPGKEPVTGKEKPTLPQTKKPPVLHYPQISWLYKYSMVNMPAEKVEEILSLEKEWLRIDLETVIYDAIKRFNFFEGGDLNDDENDFCLHALYLLKEIKAEESLPVVLELFRQPQALLDFCVLDMLTENLWQVIYTLGFNQLNKLAEFLKEPLNYTFSRTAVSVALTQIILHHTEKREEVIGVYKDVIDCFISNKNDETIIDADFIDLMIADIIDFNGTELLPGIKELFNAGIVDEFVVGSLEDVLKEFNDLQAGEDVDHKKVLQDYFEIVKDFAEWQKNNEDDDEYYGDEDDEENDEEIFNDYEEVEEDKTTQFYSDDKPYVRSVPKVARNEICPCGSGKKYKNCHGINE